MFGLIWKEELENYCCVGCTGRRKRHHCRGGCEEEQPLGKVGGRNRKFLWADTVRKARQGCCSFSRASER